MTVSDGIRAAVAQRGQLPFSEFMELALYGEGGFYSSGKGAGRRADFLTSPEVGPLFGAVVANALDTWWDELGRPDPYPVVEIGAGRGALARSVLSAAPRCRAALEYRVVERTPRPEEVPADVSWHESFPPTVTGGIVLGNELLDNLAFDIASWTEGTWRMVAVGTEGDRFVERLDDASPGLTARLDELVAEPGDGCRVPVMDEAAALVGGLITSLEWGRIVMFDYGARSTAALTERAWLRTYRAHERGFDPYVEVGDRDITTEIAVDQLPPGAAISTQQEFLDRHGVGQLVAAGRAAWQAAAGEPDVAALRMRSRLNEAAALRDPEGLGAFLVVQWSVGPTAPGCP